MLHRAIADGAEPDEDDDRWPVLWLTFGRKLHPDHDDPPASTDGDDLIDDWVEMVVTEFCKLHELKNKYASSGYASGYEEG